MKLFREWLAAKNEAGLSDFMPNMGQRAIPINQTGPQVAPQAPQQNVAPGASDLQGVMTQLARIEGSRRVTDFNWLQLLEIFERQAGRHPNDPTVFQLGTALLQAGKTGNMKGLDPYIQKYLKAQRIQ